MDDGINEVVVQNVGDDDDGIDLIGVETARMKEQHEMEIVHYDSQHGRYRVCDDDLRYDEDCDDGLHVGHHDDHRDCHVHYH